MSAPRESSTLGVSFFKEIRMQEKEVTEKQFCEIIAELLENEETKKVFDKTFPRNKECQLKK